MRAAGSLDAQRLCTAHNGSVQSGALWLREGLGLLWFTGRELEADSLFSSCLLLAQLWMSVCYCWCHSAAGVCLLLLCVL